MVAIDEEQNNDKPVHGPARREFLFGSAAAGAGLLFATQATAGGGNSTITQGTVTLTDGTNLNYLEAGSGPPIVLIPGWSQTAAMFADQLNGLSARHRVIAVDMRGHGDSSKPPWGYRMARLAQDLHEFLGALNLEGVALGGHSLGSSVIWSYWDHFGTDRFTRMIVIDQAPTVVAWPGWSDDQKAVAGTVFTPQSLYDQATALAGPDGVKKTEDLVKTAFFTKSFPADRLDWVVQQNLKFPRKPAATLLVDHCCQDWRDVIVRIRVPTIVFSGTKSIFNPRSQQWIASQIPNAQVHIFDESEGGSHFMFMENPQKFNKILLDFLG
jgi:non-heme chloroperoxidase